MAWQPVTITDDEIGAPLIQAIEQQDAAATPTQRIDWLPVTVTDDEAAAQLKLFFLDLQEPAVLQTQAVAWAAVTFLDDETWVVYVAPRRPRQRTVTLNMVWSVDTDLDMQWSV